MSVQKDWAAVNSEEEIVVRRRRRIDVVRELLGRGLDIEKHDVVAVPRPHTSMYV